MRKHEVRLLPDGRAAMMIDSNPPSVKFATIPRQADEEAEVGYMREHLWDELPHTTLVVGSIHA